MATDTPYVLAVDIGSSAVKAGIYDARANALPQTLVSIPHRQRTALDGTHEEDAPDILKATESAIDLALEAGADLAEEIVAVGFDAMASTILGIDDRMQPVTPAYTYADTRTASDVEALRLQIDVDAAYQRTGVMQHTSYVPGRISWLRRNDPDAYARVERWVDVSTYCFMRWFGTMDVPCSYSAAAWSGLLNREQLNWDAGLLDAISLDHAHLPRVAPYTQAQSGLCPIYSGRWPQLVDVPFYLAVGDGAAVNVGGGCTDSRNIALTVGTTAAMRLIVEHPLGDPPTVPAGLWAYVLGENRTLLGGAFSEGGNVVEWALSNLNLPNLDELNDALKTRDPDAHGLTVLPFLAGERAVGWATHANGVFRGVRVSTTALDMLQALMESVAYRFSLVADLLHAEMSHEHAFIAGGGAVTNSPWWLQTMADVLGSAVHLPIEEQATSRGTAILALHAVGEWKTLNDVIPKIGTVFEPRDDRYAIHRSAIERQRDMYDLVFGG